MTSQWIDATHHLKFTFGEYCFWRATFTAAELQTHPARLDNSLDETIRSALPFLDRHAAVAIPAHPVVSSPRRFSIRSGYLRYIPTVGAHYFTELGPSFDAYVRCLPRKHRHDVERKLRRFAERTGGKIELGAYRSPAEAVAFFNFAAGVSRRTYQHRLLRVGLEPTPEAARDLVARARQDAMRGWILFHRGAAIAYALAYAVGDCLRFVHIGYDPAFAEWSPGTVVIHEALRSAAGEKCFALVDFGTGEAQYKRSWATRSIRCATVFVFRPTGGHLFLVAAHRASTAASDSCTMVLDRLGAKHRIKRYFRRRAQARG